MHLFVTIKPIGKDSFSIPQHYNYILQSAIYNLMPLKISKELHNVGYMVQKRKYKLFALSNIFGKFQLNRNDETITFFDEAKFVISSPSKEFCNIILNQLITEKNIRLGYQQLAIESIKAEEYIADKKEIVLCTLSPITVYSTLLKREGAKYTVYFEPREKDFARLVTENLCKKHMAFYNREPNDKELYIQLIGKSRMHVLNYKGTFIKAYSCKLKLMGSYELMTLALNAGVGSKNSQAFGCVIPHYAYSLIRR